MYNYDNQCYRYFRNWSASFDILDLRQECLISGVTWLTWMRFQSLQEEILWLTFKSSIFVWKKKNITSIVCGHFIIWSKDYSWKVRDICLNFKSFPGIDLTLCLLSPQSLWRDSSYTLIICLTFWGPATVSLWPLAKQK